MKALRAGSGLVVVAEPGAGKTTRVPRALLDAGLAEGGEVVVLEPRRLAVRLAARRVADELGERIGERVGYQVRFEDRTGPRTRLRFVTEGILVRQLAADPCLAGVSVVVLDELHERSLQADVALALLRRLQARERPDLRIVAMSATMEAAPVARFLGCEVLEVPGRRFEVEIEHAERPDERPLDVQVAGAVRRVVDRGLSGDVLVFLPGASEIRRAREACGSVAERAGLDLVTLHGDLSGADQDRAVRRGPRPKVILSTNIAETSVTIDGVVAVVDSGLARFARHSPWSGLSSLETGPISRASAAQRAGRAGRTRPGLCLRLYTRHDHDTRPMHDPPEVRRADLCEVVLLLRASGHDPRALEWLEAPPAAALDAAETLLERLGAIDEAGAATERGRAMLRLPLHPRLSRVLLEAAARGVPERGALLAAVIAEREFRRAARTRLEGGPAAIHAVGESDLFERMEAFDAVEIEGLSASRIRAHDLDVGAVHQVARVRDLLEHRVRAMDVGVRKALTESEESALGIAVLAGFPNRVGRRRGPRSDQVVFASGGSGRLAPVSVVREADFLVAVEAEGRRGGSATIRAASAIEPEWLLELFPERVEEQREVRFDAGTERVDAVIKLTYDGLVLDESKGGDQDGAEMSRVLAEAALAAGLGRFWDADALERLRARATFAAAHGLPLDLSAPVVEQTLRVLCEGCRSFADLRGLDLIGALRGRVAAADLARLERLAPEAVPIAGRARVPVEYPEGGGPFIASRLQDFFGMTEGPRIAGGAVPLVLHLLAPNRRPVQVTTDLAGFWERHYPALRKQLGRRYPKHAWPDDPRAASPGRR